MKGLMERSFVPKIDPTVTFYHVVLNIHPYLYVLYSSACSINCKIFLGF